MIASTKYGSWICCQIGAREHYVVPVGLHRRGALESMITDFWVDEHSLLAWSNRNLAGRFSRELADAKVHATNARSLAFASWAHLRGLNGWRLIRERNLWFQKFAISQLAHIQNNRNLRTVTLFSYSYAARDLMKFARDQGWRTVLEQIDAGPLAERIDLRLHEETPWLQDQWQPAPPEYWDDWREECGLADHIVVNSAWTRDAIIREGVGVEKIRVIPLVFDKRSHVDSVERQYPSVFTLERPLRVLLLGQINLSKGVAPVLEAARLLRDDPVEFIFVGPIQIAIPDEFKNDPRVRWIGVVPRNEVDKYYRDSDVFLFPTFSDGFGLTQLEAQSWKLPIVASRFCGEVVCSGINGILLDELNGETIATVLLELAREPAKLATLAAHAGMDDRFELDTFTQSLLAL